LVVRKTSADEMLPSPGGLLRSTVHRPPKKKKKKNQSRSEARKNIRGSEADFVGK